MKKFFGKKALVLLAVLALGMMLLAGCGDNADAPDQGDQQQATVMTEEEYQAKVTELSNAISEKSAAANQGLDGTDPGATVNAMQALIGEVTPLYTELANLQAPDTFKDAQAKIKVGAESSLELLELSNQMFEFAADPEKASSADAQEKLTELQTKMADLQAKSADFTAGLQEVMSK